MHQNDHQEDAPVTECLVKLMNARNPQLLSLLPQLLVVIAKMVPDSSGVDGHLRGSLV